MAIASEDKMQYASAAIVCLVCIVSVVNAVISLNCVADKKWNCAQVSGILAIVCGCMGMVALLIAFRVK